MKHFIRDIFGVVIASIILLVVLESLQFLVPNTYSYKRDYIENHQNDISILLLGHSHVLRGVDPHILGDSTFNFAESGRWIYYDAKIVERYVPQMNNLRLLIYPIGYDMPAGYLSNHYEHDCPGFEDDNHDYNIHMYAKFLNIPYDRWPMRITAYSAFLSGYLAKEEFEQKQLKCDSLGFETLNSTLHWSNWEEMHLPHLLDSIISDTTHNSIYVDEYILHLKKIAKICYEHDIRFVSITTPCHKNYVEKTSQAGLNNLQYVVSEVGKEYPIEYFNYLGDEEFSNDSLFIDCSHLNYLGAEKFSLRLRKDLGL